MTAQGSFFFAGLTSKQSQLLGELVSDVDPTKPELYPNEARQHIKEAEAAAPNKPQLNFKLARALVSVIENVVARWFLWNGQPKKNDKSLMVYPN